MKPQNYFYTSAFLIFSCFFIEDGSSSSEIAIYIALGLSLLFAIIGIVIWIINRSKQ